MISGLFVNAKVFTGCGEHSFVTAFRISNDAFVWVGDQERVRGEPAVDLGGRTVVPGMLDMHTHPARLSTMARSMDCLPPRVTSMAQLLDQLRAHPDLGAGPERWVYGRGFDDSKFPDRRPPTKEDLDQVTSEQPVVVWRCDGHSAVCNSRALAMAGITEATPDPSGGRFDRDAHGRPNGVLIEHAAVGAVTDRMPSPSRDEQIRDLARLSEHFFSLGIVGMCDLRATVIPDPLRTFRSAWEHGPRPRCSLYYEWDGDHPPADLDDADRRGRTRVGGLKLFMDGAYSNRTAWVNDPYPDSCEHGIHTVSDESARAALDWARRNRVQLAVHAMGDRALDHVVDLFGAEEPWLTGGPSVRIEHATLVSRDLLRRIVGARMSFGMATHVNFLFAEHESYRENLGANQLDIAYPVRTLYDAIPRLALSSDCPATAWSNADDVFLSVKAAVVRRAYNGADIGQGSRISVPQALMLYTGRARHVADLGPVGLIDPGYEANFVVLDRDVFTIDDDEIDQVQVDETWIRGAKVYARSR